MKTLIIPDIHLKFNIVDEILKKIAPLCDQVLFLGDYFDDYSDSVMDNHSAAVWLKSNLDNPKYKFLIGNHDIQYAFSSGFTCSGFTHYKHKAIREVLNPSDWEKFHLYHFLHHRLLCSHAGITKHFLLDFFPHNQKITHIDLREFLEKAEKEFRSFEFKYKNVSHRSLGAKILQAGRDRGGENLAGGILWSDARSYEGFGETNISQIVGHTRLLKPTVFNNSGVSTPYYDYIDLCKNDVIGSHGKSNSLFCIDTNLNHFAVYERYKSDKDLFMNKGLFQLYQVIDNKKDIEIKKLNLDHEI